MHRIISGQGSGSKMKVKNRISSTDLFFIIVQTIIGIGLLSLPYEAYQTARGDGWIAVLLSGVFIHLIVLLLWMLCRKFPNLTLFDFSKIIVGRILGTIINILYIVYFLAVVCYIFIIFTDTLKRWIFPETPAWVLFFIGIVLLIYGSMCTIKNIVSLFSFFFIFILVLIFITFLVYLDPSLDVRYIFPIGSSGGWNILKGSYDIIISFIGYETLLIYFAFIKRSQQVSALKGVLTAVTFITFYFTYITVISIMLVSPEEMLMTPKIVVHILSGIGMHVLSRLDLIFLSIWGPVVLMTIISYSFAAGMGISKVFHLHHKISLILFGVALFLISVIFYYVEISVLQQWIKHFGLIFSIVIPIILLLIAIISKKELASNDEKD